MDAVLQELMLFDFFEMDDTKMMVLFCLGLTYMVYVIIKRVVLRQIEKENKRMDLSLRMSMFLDLIGYSNERIKARKIIAENSLKNIGQTSAKVNNTPIRFDQAYFAGSNGEGVTFALDSDADCLYVDSRDFSTICDVMPSNPGYVFLIERQPQDLQTALLTFKEAFNRQDTVTVGPLQWSSLGRQGPAFSAVMNIQTAFGNLSMHKNDFVHGFHCQFPNLLNAWCTRQRHHNWPSPKMVATVASFPAFVVNAGLKASYLYDYQWRICFTPAEMFLSSSFNSTQMKVYILLRTIAKNILRPVCEDVTSYIVKNIVFWLCEKTDTKLFIEQRLLDRMWDALELLKTSIEKRNLPNYMIPERNLFQGRLQSSKKLEQLVQTIHKLQTQLQDTFQEIFESEENVKVPIFMESKNVLLTLSEFDLKFVEVYNQMGW